MKRIVVLGGGFGGIAAAQRLETLQRSQKQAILDLCLRRDQLRLRERARLFRTVAQHCRERLGLTPQEYESDEKFILQVAAVLTAAPGGARGAPAREEALAGEVS